MKILTLILSFFILSNNSNFEFKIIRDNGNQTFLWEIESIKDENGKDVINTKSIKNDVIPIKKEGKYLITFKSKFGNEIQKQYLLSTKKRKVKVKIPKNFYEELKPKEILKGISKEEEFSIYKLYLGCWGEAETVWNFKNRKTEIELVENNKTEVFSLTNKEYDKILKSLLKLKKDKKSIRYRDFFAIKVQNKIAVIDGGKNLWKGYYRLKEKLEKK